MNSSVTGTFWEHLDDLRSVLIRVAIAIVIFGIVAFIFGDTLFSVVLAPSCGDFITYRAFEHIAAGVTESIGVSNFDTHFNIKLISTQLTGQFTAHIKMAFYVGFMLTLPYILFEIFRFVSPALRNRERRVTVWVVVSAYVMFMLGVALSYFLIFPLTFHFLGTYQVSSLVENQIVIDSYISTLLMMNLMMGVVFEIPILALIFARLGIISSGFMCKFRKHAIVVLLVIAMVITPTSDIVTLVIVALPMYLLYEISILLVRVCRS